MYKSSLNGTRCKHRVQSHFPKRDKEARCSRRYALVKVFDCSTVSYQPHHTETNEWNVCGIDPYRDFKGVHAQASRALSPVHEYEALLEQP